MCDAHGTCGACGPQGHSASRASIKLLRYQIATQGYGISFAFDRFPCFAYTVGLEETFRHPEMLVSGKDYEISQRILTDLIGVIRTGADTAEGTLHVAGGTPVLLTGVAQPISDRLEAAAEYYGGRPFRVLQVLWPDKEGRFPTDETCDEGVRAGQSVSS